MKFKFALVEGVRCEAQPRLSGKCISCGAEMIAKCGKIKVWHWAHKGTRSCDPWWEPETEWHRDWKNRFPKDWQEAIHQSENGEKHIADVKTASGMVLEFQHSNLHQDERISRDNFYPKMVWVVDGRRRVRDRAQFFASLRTAPVVKANPLTVSFPSNEGALLRDWGASRVPVFFDFGDLSEHGDTLSFAKPVLWQLIPGSPNGKAYLSPVLKTSFVNAHVDDVPLDGFDYSVALERARLLRVARYMRALRWSEHQWRQKIPRYSCPLWIRNRT